MSKIEKLLMQKIGGQWGSVGTSPNNDSKYYIVVWCKSSIKSDCLKYYVLVGGFEDVLALEQNGLDEMANRIADDVEKDDMKRLEWSLLSDCEIDDVSEMIYWK